MAREQKWPHGSPQARSIDERALGAARDKIVRNNSVANDIRLDLPVSIQRLEEEERPRRSPQLQPSGYDSRSEIQRPYIKPPPNKTVCCIPEPNGNNRGSPSCSCGPTIIQKISSSTGNSSGWGLSWSSGSKSPPPHSRHRQQQRHAHSSNPSTCRPSSVSCGTKPQKSGFAPPSGVIGNFLAGVIISASEKGNGSQCKESDNVKSITQQNGSHGPDLGKFRFVSERKPVNDRTSPNPNVNSSMCSGTQRQTGDAVLIANNSQNFKYDEIKSSQSYDRKSVCVKEDSVSSSPIASAYSTDVSVVSGNEEDRRRKFDRKYRKKDRIAPSAIDADGTNMYQDVEPNTCGFRLASNHNYCWDLLDGNSSVNNGPPISDTQLYPSVQPYDSELLLSESIQETHYELSEPATPNQLTISDTYCTSTDVTSSSEISNPTPEHSQDVKNGRRFVTE